MVRQVAVTASNTPIPHTRKKSLPGENSLLDFGNDSGFLEFLNEHMISCNISDSKAQEDMTSDAVGSIQPLELQNTKDKSSPLSIEYENLKSDDTCSESESNQSSIHQNQILTGKNSIPKAEHSVFQSRKRPITIPRSFRFHNNIKTKSIATISNVSDLKHSTNNSNIHTTPFTESNISSKKPAALQMRPDPMSKRVLTHPISPKFATRERFISKVTRSSDISKSGSTSQDAKAHFRILENSRHSSSRTCFESNANVKPFVFRTRDRARAKSTASPTEFNPPPTFKAQPLPKYYSQIKINPSSVHLKDENSDMYNFSFHAQPVRTKLGHIPSIPSRPLTVPEPFNLGPNSRSSSLAHDDDNDTDINTNFHFKAKPMPNHAPFIPKRSIKPLTLVPDDLHLKTELRAFDREVFEQKMKKKQALLETYKKQQLKERQLKEKLEMIRLRASTVHHPLSMPNFHKSA